MTLRTADGTQPEAASPFLSLLHTKENAGPRWRLAMVGGLVVLDLAITSTNYAYLITLSGNYAAATNDAQRAVFEWISN